MLLGQQMPVGQDRVRPGVAAGQLAQAGDRVADCRVPGERLVAAAAALGIRGQLFDHSAPAATCDLLRRRLLPEIVG